MNTLKNSQSTREFDLAFEETLTQVHVHHLGLEVGNKINILAYVNEL